MFCTKCQREDVQSLLYKVWLLFFTMCGEDVQSLLCQMMGAPFIGICFFVRCEVFVPNAREVGMLVYWRWLGTYRPEYFSAWVLVGLGTFCNELYEWMLSAMVFGGRIATVVDHALWWPYSTLAFQALVVLGLLRVSRSGCYRPHLRMDV